MIALLTVVLAIPMTVSAAAVTGGAPVHDSTENLITASKLVGIAACNGGGKARDLQYGFLECKDTLSSGMKVVLSKTDEEFAVQTYPFSAGVATAWGAMGLLFYACPDESKMNIDCQNQKVEGKETMTDGKYDSFIVFSLNGGSETKVSSVVITMPASTTFMAGQLNGFDLYVGTEVFQTTKEDGSNSSYKLAYTGMNLVDTGMWKDSADGTYSFLEINLDKPMIGSYIAIGFTPEGYSTCPKGAYKSAVGEEGTECWFVNFGEFAAFETTIEEAAAAAATTAEITTEAPKTEPKTEPAATEPSATEPEATDAPTAAPVITAAPGTEPNTEKKGCGSSVVILPAAAVLALAVTVCRKKKD